MGQALKSYAYLAGFLLASFIFFKYVLPFIFPFVLALFLAVFIDPAVAGMERRLRLPRAVGAAVVIVAVLGISAFLLVVGMARLGLELVDLMGSLPLGYQQLTDLVEGAAEMLGQFSASLPPVLKQVLDRQLAGSYQTLVGLLNGVVTALQNLLAALPGLAMVFLITAIATYLISRDKVIIRSFLIGWVPREWRTGVLAIKADVLASTVGLIKAQAVLVFLTFLVVLGSLTALGARYALSMAVLAAFLDVLPVLGPSLLFIPWAAYAFLTGDASLAFWLLVLYGGVALVRGVAQPYVIGERLGLHPLTVLVALYLGVKVWGPAGFVYGPLVAIVLKAAIASGLLPAGPGGGGRAA